MSDLTYENPWVYNGQILQSEDITEYVGMVYLLKNTINNKQYIGKKFFWTKAYRSIKGKRKRVKVESDWKKYYGSSNKLAADIEEIGVDKIERHVLLLCNTKTQCAYYELKEQVERNVLLREAYYNEFVGGKINGRHLEELK